MAIRKMKPRASRWLRFKRWLTLEPEQSPVIWCPRCGNEMVSDPKTTTEMTGEGLLVYRCHECTTRSAWDMSTPVPVLIHTQGKDRRSENRGGQW
jgi:DNA-directed RNA polymerase subunit RPC12/RpoP